MVHTRRAVRLCVIQVKGRLNEERLATLMTSIRDWNLFWPSTSLMDARKEAARLVCDGLFRLVAGV